MPSKAVATLIFLCLILDAWALFGADVVLGQTPVDGDILTVSLRSRENASSVLAVGVGNSAGAQSFNLTSPPLEQQNAALAEALSIVAKSPDSSQLAAQFGIANASGDARWVAVWMRKQAGRWSLCGEWVVEKYEHKEAGEHNERQAFVFLADGNLSRAIVRNNVDGVQTTCPQGCCKIWQTRTLRTQELETYALNASGSSERVSVRKWYLAQANDALFFIAAKVYGNAGRMGALLALNPELQKQEFLTEGQRVLYEVWPK